MFAAHDTAIGLTAESQVGEMTAMSHAETPTEARTQAEEECPTAVLLSLIHRLQPREDNPRRVTHDLELQKSPVSTPTASLPEGPGHDRTNTAQTASFPTGTAHSRAPDALALLTVGSKISSVSATTAAFPQATAATTVFGRREDPCMTHTLPGTADMPYDNASLPPARSTDAPR